jgi:hypothetical protein
MGMRVSVVVPVRTRALPNNDRRNRMEPLVRSRQASVVTVLLQLRTVVGIPESSIKARRWCQNVHANPLTAPFETRP